MYKPYSFDTDFITIPDTYKVKLDELNLESHGVILKSRNSDVQLIISCIAEYPNNKLQSFLTNITLLNNNVSTYITPYLLEEAFKYNPKYNSFPLSVEFIMYPISYSPLKWLFNFT